MRKYLVVVSLFYASLLEGQIKNFVRKSAIRISSISPSSTVYSDLEPIGEALGNAQLVLLGEQDHGDAATFLAKTRLIKYLHEKKGFNVLAFESDFFGLNEGFSGYDKDSTEISVFLKNNILSPWAYCSACNDLLYNYIPSTYKSKSPMMVTGFDDQMVYDYSRKYLVKRLDSILQRLNLQIVKQANYYSEILPLIDNLVSKYWYQRPADSSFVKCGKFLIAIRKQISDRLSENDFWVQIVDNLIADNEGLLNLKNEKWNSETIRDKQMFFNLKWLSQVKYSKQKIIVWAANNHVAKYSDREYTSMGQFLSIDSTMGPMSYSIGFTSYWGESGRLNERKFKIDKPKKMSLENWIDTSFKYAFVDFVGFNRLFPSSNEPFEMRKWRYWSSKGEWNKIFDGVFYIKEMFPCVNN